MAISYVDFSVEQYSDKPITVQVSPPTDISSWELQFKMKHRFGGESGLIIKNCASGYTAGQSGITFVTPTQGVFSIRLNSVDTSGLQPALAYAYDIDRLQSGSRTPITKGYVLLSANTGP